MKKAARAAVAIVALVGGLSLAQVASAESKYVMDFETRFGVNGISQGRITSDKSMVISGAKSFLCDSMKSKQEWNELLHSDTSKIVLERGASYTVDFDYKITNTDEDETYYYFMARLSTADWSGHDKGWTTWKASDEEEGHKTITLDLDDLPSYRLTFGIYGKGAIVIDNLVIEKS